MIDFGLRPCPLCGCAAEVEVVKQGPERLYAEIRCTGCTDTVEAAVEVKETDRFVTEEHDTISATMSARIVKDTETGVRYLVVDYGRGVGVTKLEEGEGCG